MTRPGRLANDREEEKMTTEGSIPAYEGVMIPDDYVSHIYCTSCCICSVRSQGSTFLSLSSLIWLPTEWHQASTETAGAGERPERGCECVCVSMWVVCAGWEGWFGAAVGRGRENRGVCVSVFVRETQCSSTRGLQCSAVSHGTVTELRYCDSRSGWLRLKDRTCDTECESQQLHTDSAGLDCWSWARVHIVGEHNKVGDHMLAMFRLVLFWMWWRY